MGLTHRLAWTTALAGSERRWPNKPVVTGRPATATSAWGVISALDSLYAEVQRECAANRQQQTAAQQPHKVTLGQLQPDHTTLAD